jgi:MYXO-CTERM domain-containing protein
VIKPDLNRLAALSFVSPLTLALALGALVLPGCMGAAPTVTGTTEEEPAALAATPYVAHPSQPMSCNANGQRFHCKGHIRSDVRPQLAPDAVTAGFGPADLTAAYALDATLKPTAIIAIVDAFGYVNAESDLAAYRTKYALPACTVASGCLTIVNQEGKTTPLPSAPPAGDDWTVETALDLDMASAACPSCKLLLVQANDDTSDGLMIAQAAAAGLGASVISNSWGGPESTASLGSTQEKFFQLGKPVTIFVAAGDAGYDDGGSGPDYPSVSAFVIAVGGTSLVKSAAGGTRGWSETAWATSTKAAGAGGSSCSISIPKPTYQSALNTQCTFRAAADLAAVGDPATGVAVYNKNAGGFIVVGGTSASSPFVAGVFALYGKGGAAPSYPYSNTGAFFDVLTGSNGTCGNILCNATKGWDGPTGVGTPNGAMFMTAAPDMATAPVDMAMAPPDLAQPVVSTGGGGGSTATGGGSSGSGGGSTSGNGATSGGTSTSGSTGGIGCSLGGAASAGSGWLFSLGFVLVAAWRRRRSSID